MTVSELMDALEDLGSSHEVLIVDGAGGWMTPVQLTDDEDRVIMRLEPVI